MKKYSSLKLIFMAMSIFAAGCTSSIENGKNLHEQSLSCPPGITECHTNANISGLYILGLIPISCGDPDVPGHTVWFQNKVSLDNALDMLTKNANELGASKTYNIQSNIYSTCWASSLYLLWVKNVQVSGNVIR